MHAVQTRRAGWTDGGGPTCSRMACRGPRAREGRRREGAADRLGPIKAEVAPTWRLPRGPAGEGRRGGFPLPPPVWDAMGTAGDSRRVTNINPSLGGASGVSPVSLGWAQGAAGEHCRSVSASGIGEQLHSHRETRLHSHRDTPKSR